MWQMRLVPAACYRGDVDPPKARPLVTMTDRKAGAVQEERREQLVEEIRTAERARDLLAGLERRLKERDRSGLENHLSQLERLAGSLPEEHTVRLLVDDAVQSARARGAGYAGSAASRSRSKTEGRLSSLRGILARDEAFANREA